MSHQKEENKNVDIASRKTEELSSHPPESQGENVYVNDWKHAATRTKKPTNSPEGSETEGVSVTVDDWKHAWEVGCFTLQEENPNVFLTKYIIMLTLGRPSVSVFVPLCGKSVDMRWLYDQVLYVNHVMFLCFFYYCITLNFREHFIFARFVKIKCS